MKRLPDPIEYQDLHSEVFTINGVTHYPCGCVITEGENGPYDNWYCEKARELWYKVDRAYFVSPKDYERALENYGEHYS